MEHKLVTIPKVKSGKTINHVLLIADGRKHLG